MQASELLREARRRSGLSLRQLAVRGRTSHATIAAYESGAKDPGAATLTRLVRACGFEVEAALRPVDPFDDRRARGDELRQVLDLADQFPARHGHAISARFPPG